MHSMPCNNCWPKNKFLNEEAALNRQEERREEKYKKTKAKMKRNFFERNEQITHYIPNTPFPNGKVPTDSIHHTRSTKKKI